MANIISVKQLAKLIKKQIEKGNGDKKIYISSDDEGNEYHPLFFGFTDEKSDIEMCLECSHTELWDNEVQDIIILG